MRTDFVLLFWLTVICVSQIVDGQIGYNFVPDGQSTWRLNADTNNRDAIMSFCVQGPGSLEFSWNKDVRFGSAFNLFFYIGDDDKTARYYNINSPKISEYFSDNKKQKVTWVYKQNPRIRCNNCDSSAQVKDVSFNNLKIFNSCDDGSCPINISSNMTFQEVQDILKNRCNKVVLNGVVDDNILQSIVDSADNRLIQLDGVQYNASLVIRREGLTIESKEGGRAILDGGNKSYVIKLFGVERVVIKNITIQNAEYGIVFDEAELCKGSHLDIKSFQKSGVCIWDAIGNSIENNNIQSSSKKATGIWLRNSNKNTIENNELNLTNKEISFGEWFVNSHGNVVNKDRVLAANETFLLQNSTDNIFKFICLETSYIFDNSLLYNVTGCVFPYGEKNLTSEFNNSWEID